MLPNPVSAVQIQECCSADGTGVVPQLPPIVLHVGHNGAYKNRDGVLRTVARIREQASLIERQRLGKRIRTLKVGSSCSFHVSGVSLMESLLTREGALYSRIALVNLKNRLSSGSA